MRGVVFRRSPLVASSHIRAAPAVTYISRRWECSAHDAPPKPATAALSSRWLSDAKQRIGRCITFGLQREQVYEASRILQEMARDWRELVAGSEGFLTGPQRRGLFRHKIVWGEQDAMGHINNVMYNRYAETGRVEWTKRYARYIDPANATAWDELVAPSEVGLILRKITTDFKFPLRYPDHISVYHKLGIKPQAGSDAFQFEVVIMSELHQRIAARATEDCALYDYRIGKKTSFKPFMLDVLNETWRLQEEAQTVNSDRVRTLLDRVRQLELESWDREGAVEDVGSRNR